MSVIDMPDDPEIEAEIRAALLALPTKTRVALLSDLKVRDPGGFIPKERMTTLKKLHDIYVFPAGERTPCAVVVRSGYDDRHILAGISLERVGKAQAKAMAARALGLRWPEDEAKEDEAKDEAAGEAER